MNIAFKLGMILACFVACSAVTTEDELCLSYCGSNLLKFKKMALRHFYRTMMFASSCVTYCAPPQLQKFFRIIIDSVTEKIPEDCAYACDQYSPFVYLAKCVEEVKEPLLYCSTMLIDLTHFGLVDHPVEGKKKVNCSIILNALDCMQDSLHLCNRDRISEALYYEILRKIVIKTSSAYCPKEYRRTFIKSYDDRRKPRWNIWFEKWLFEKNTVLKQFSNTSISPGPHYKHSLLHNEDYITNSANERSTILFIYFLLSTFSIMMFLASPIYRM